MTAKKPPAKKAAAKKPSPKKTPPRAVYADGLSERPDGWVKVKMRMSLAGVNFSYKSGDDLYVEPAEAERWEGHGICAIARDAPETPAKGAKDDENGGSKDSALV